MVRWKKPQVSLIPSSTTGMLPGDWILPFFYCTQIESLDIFLWIITRLLPYAGSWLYFVFFSDFGYAFAVDWHTGSSGVAEPFFPACNDFWQQNLWAMFKCELFPVAGKKMRFRNPLIFGVATSVGALAFISLLLWWVCNLNLMLLHWCQSSFLKLCKSHFTMILHLDRTRSLLHLSDLDVKWDGNLGNLIQSFWTIVDHLGCAHLRTLAHW